MGDESTLIRRLMLGEEDRACRLVRKVFIEFVAPLYEQDGVDEFLRYVDPDLMAQRAQSNHFSLSAEDGGKLIGLIEMRDFNHISLLFVSGHMQRRGIGGKLLKEALQIARQHVPGLSKVTVHSSPNAVSAYEHLGFEVQGPEKLDHGIRYIPMKLSLGDVDGG